MIQFLLLHFSLQKLPHLPKLDQNFRVLSCQSFFLQVLLCVVTRHTANGPGGKINSIGWVFLSSFYWPGINSSTVLKNINVSEKFKHFWSFGTGSPVSSEEMESFWGYCRRDEKVQGWNRGEEDVGSWM